MSSAAPASRATLKIKARVPAAGRESFFASCPRGLEPVLAAELAELGAARIAESAGGVGFQGDFAFGRRVCLWSRVASRVLWRLADAEYRSEADLYRLARYVDWPHLFSARETIRVQVDAVGSPLRSLEFVTLRIKDAIVDTFRAAMASRPSVDTARPDMRIHLFLTAYRATLYLDLAGEALFKRGYRREGLTAPLRENLAAGMLLLKGWRGGRPLLDPMMGSGTILCEAAMIATGRAPGVDRAFAFEKLRGHDTAAWKAQRAEASAGQRTLQDRLLTGGDVLADAVVATRAHLEALGGPAWGERVQLHHGPVETLEAGSVGPAGGLLLTNPPYGERLDELQRLRAWYPSLGAWMKRSLTGWTACFLTADTEFAGGIGLRPRRRTPLFNGPLECRLFEFDMYAGTRRHRPDADAAGASG